MNCEIIKSFEGHDGEDVTNWKNAICVHFEAHVTPEDADKAENTCIARAKRFCSTHPGSHVFEEERTFRPGSYRYPGDTVIVGCSVYKNEY